MAEKGVGRLACGLQNVCEALDTLMSHECVDFCWSEVTVVVGGCLRVMDIITHTH